MSTKKTPRRAAVADPAPTPNPTPAPAPTPPEPSPGPSRFAALIATWKARAQALYDVLIAPLGLRTLLLAGLAAYLLSSDLVAAKSFAFNLGLVLAALALVQWYRKAHMPYLDQATIIGIAEQTPLGAAIVYAATRGFDAVILLFVLFAGLR